MATGALGALTGVRAEVEARMRDQLERVLARMDLVTREEFEAVQAMAAKARTEQEALEQRVAELEARLATAAMRSRHRRRAAPAALASSRGASGRIRVDAHDDRSAIRGVIPRLRVAAGSLAGYMLW